MVLDSFLVNTHYCKVGIKGKVEQGKEQSPPLYFGVIAIEKGSFGSLTFYIKSLKETGYNQRLE